MREKHTLSLGSQTLLRTASLGHLLRTTLANLAELARPEGPRIRGRLLLAEDHAVLLHSGLPTRSVQKAALRLRTRGYRQAGLATTVFDARTGEVVLADPAESLHLRKSALRELAQESPPDGREPDWTTARIPLRQILVPAHTLVAADRTAPSRGEPVASPAALTLALADEMGFPWERVNPARLRAASRLAAAVEVTVVTSVTAEEITTALRDQRRQRGAGAHR